MNGIWYHIDGPIEKGSIHILLGWFEQLNPLVQHRIKKKCLPDAPLNEMNSIQKRIFIINIWRVFGAGEWKIHKEPGRLSKGAQNDFKAPFAIEWKPDSNKNQMKWTKLNCSQINKTIIDGRITVDFSIIKVHTSNWSSNSWGSSNSSCWDHRIVGDHRIPLDL